MTHPQTSPAQTASSAGADAALVETTAGLRSMANAVRALSMDAVEAAKSGHPGMPMGMADVATVLFTKTLKFDAGAPDWADRDRFVLSAGHGSMLLYSLLYLTGFESITLDDIRNFRKLGRPSAGHPDFGHAGGIETTTGPLGQGIGNAVGMALAERIMNTRYGDALVDHRTYVIAGDGDLMEGISHEACSLAGHLKLNRLVVLYDDNEISIDGPTSLSDSTDVLGRFTAMGWAVKRIDGHNADAIEAALEWAKTSIKPVLIACKTIIGYGAPKRAGTSKSHGEALGAEEIEGARAALNWPHEPFVIPENILAAWRKAGARGRAAHESWQSKLSASAERGSFAAALSGDIPSALGAAMDAYKTKLKADKPNVASRKASEMALAVINPIVTNTIGGSADLTGSNLTQTKDTGPITPTDYSGRFIHYGVREHGMAAAMNGMALHGGLIPYSGTFLVFSDYCRPAIRLAALMSQRVIHVMTHDSIGLGEDGPTHQPIEHLASLRAIPNLLTLRPADAVETAECWEIALNSKMRPSVLALSRQGLPTIREEAGSENLSSRGAYVLRESEGAAAVTLIATGSEVEIALNARDTLQAQGVGTRVVSMPSWELFEEQSDAYKNSVIDGDTVRVAIEAACPMGWDRYTGADGAFIGMRSFGASAPAKDLYKHFGITAEAAVEAALARLNH
jgi:transketolase